MGYKRKDISRRAGHTVTACSTGKHLDTDMNTWA